MLKLKTNKKIDIATRKKIISKTILVFLIATLAYSIFFLFGLAYHEPLGSSNYFSAYLFGYILHIPFWIFVFKIGEIFNNSVLKLKISQSIIVLSISIIVFILLAPILFDKFARYEEDFILLFYIIDFLMCFSVLYEFEKKILR